MSQYPNSLSFCYENVPSGSITKVLLYNFLASIASQQTALDNYVNLTHPDGFIQFAHRCIRNQPEKCPRGFINIEIFNATINE